MSEDAVTHLSQVVTVILWIFGAAAIVVAILLFINRKEEKTSLLIAELICTIVVGVCLLLQPPLDARLDHFQQARIEQDERSITALSNRLKEVDVDVNEMVDTNQPVRTVSASARLRIGPIGGTGQQVGGINISATLIISDSNDRTTRTIFHSESIEWRTNLVPPFCAIHFSNGERYFGPNLAMMSFVKLFPNKNVEQARDCLNTAMLEIKPDPPQFLFLDGGSIEVVFNGNLSSRWHLNQAKLPDGGAIFSATQIAN